MDTVANSSGGHDVVEIRAGARIESEHDYQLGLAQWAKQCEAAVESSINDYIDATIVRQELLQGCFHAMHRLTAQNAPAEMVSTSWRPEPTAGDRLGALPVSQQAQHASRARDRVMV